MSTSKKISSKNLSSPFKKKFRLEQDEWKSRSVPNLTKKSTDLANITNIKEALPPLETGKPRNKFSFKGLSFKSKQKREKSYNIANNSKPGSINGKTGDPNVGNRLAENNPYSATPKNRKPADLPENVGYIGTRSSSVSKPIPEASEEGLDYYNVKSPNEELPEYACADDVRASLGNVRISSDSESCRTSSSTEGSRDSRDSLTPRSLRQDKTPSQGAIIPVLAPPAIPYKPASIRGKPLEPEINTDSRELVPRPPARQVFLNSGRATLPQGLKSGLRRRTTYETVDEAPESNLTKGISEYGLPGELRKLPHQPWYWGPLNQEEAEAKLRKLPDGYFLVRDSSDERYLLSLSFNSNGRPVHTRFEYVNGLFSINDSEGYASVVELINEAVRESQNGVFSFMQSSHGTQTFPARLTHWVSRFSEVKSLQHLARFVIRETFPRHYVQELPVPRKILEYILENQYA